MKHIALAAALLLMTAPAYAGPGHDHGHSHGGDSHAHSEVKTLDESGITAAATDALPALVDQGQEVDGAPLPEAWLGAVDTAKVHQKGNGYYIVSFTGEKDEALYLLLSDAGEVYDANFSGEFESLK